MTMTFTDLINNCSIVIVCHYFIGLVISMLMSNEGPALQLNIAMSYPFLLLGGDNFTVVCVIVKC